MIKTYLVNNITQLISGVVSTITPIYIIGDIYNGSTAVDDSLVPSGVSDEDLITSYHYTGSSWVYHTPQTDFFSTWDATSHSWVAAAPTPTITSVVVTEGVRYIKLSWEVTETTWATLYPFQTEIWTNTVNDFSTATLLATVLGITFTESDTATISRYYWLRAKWVDDITDYFGTTSTTGSVLPYTLETKDITPGAVTDTGFIFSALPGSGGTVLSGAGISSGLVVLSLTINNTSSSTEDYLLLLNALQTYTSTPVNTNWLIYNYTDSVTVANFNMQTIQTPYVSLSAAVAIAAGTTKVIYFVWYADSSINLANLSSSYMAFKI